MRKKYGDKTAEAIVAFRKKCTEQMTPTQYYEGVGAHDNEHPWAWTNCEQLLDKEVEDSTAKRFFKVMAKSTSPPRATTPTASTRSRTS